MSSEILTPLLALIIGFVLSQIAEWFKERRISSRDRADRINAFQRESIVEAQDMTEKLFALHQEAKLVNIHEPHLMVNPHAIYSPAMLVESTQTVLRISTLRARIDDQQLVSLLEAIGNCSVTLGSAEENHQPGDEAAMGRAIMQFNKRAGEVLPDLY